MNSKGFSACLWLGLVTLLPACSFHRTEVALAPVGPAPIEQPPGPNDGGLVVYSALNLYGDPRNIIHHSDYTVVAEDGKKTRQVANHLDRFDKGPQRIVLPAGTYTVTARSAHNGWVKVPVIVEPKQTTYVYLDGYPHPGAPSAVQGNAVTLPNGEIAGWSVSASGK